MSDTTKDAIVIERTFDAPVNLIWQLWTQPEHFKHWYAPDHFIVSVAELDVRVGGKHLICLDCETPDGVMKLWTVGEYTEIVPNQRLVYTEVLSDEHGNVLPPSTYGFPDDQPMITEVRVLLEEKNGRTRMVMTHTGFKGDMQSGVDRWEESFAKFADYLATQ